MKKIYFCGSIRGGRSDVELYQKIIKYIQSAGHKVLTEHIASPEIFGLERNQSDNEIWIQDMAWLKESDLVIAECSTPSLGVGYELAEAKHLGKKTIVFARKRELASSLSAMISGDPYYDVYIYSAEEELFSKLESIFEFEGD